MTVIENILDRKSLVSLKNQQWPSIISYPEIINCYDSWQSKTVKAENSLSKFLK